MQILAKCQGRSEAPTRNWGCDNVSGSQACCTSQQKWWVNIEHLWNGGRNIKKCLTQIYCWLPWDDV